MLILLYPSTEFGAPLQASGRYGAHGDFINGWKPEMQAEARRSAATEARYNRPPAGL